MKELAWSDILSVSVEEIDEDHRKLLHIFNILNHAVADRESAEYVAAVLDELINCTVWHFSHEERLMLKYGYGG
ncbi:MAG: hemerythrin, partial [Rhodocyclales bacterium CG17_big_fil_post_rev_8_21_14_2_50_68_7]